jgi:branched-chain amino acid transport system substrate-binding protein
MHTIAPDILKAAKPVLFGGTDPALTALGNPWLFRCQPNDSYSARAMAEFGVGTLGKRSWAIVHSSDPFGTSGGKALQAALERLGAKVAIDVDYKNQQANFTDVVQKVKASDADVLASYVSFEPDQIAIVRQMRAAGVSLPWVGSQFIAATAVLQQAGEAVFGTYAVAAFNADASKQARAFAERYEKAYGARADFFAAWPCDAVTILARAINEAGSTEAAAVRSAILAIRGFNGAEGTFDFDANGDGLHGYNIVRNDDGRIVFMRRFDFTD